MVTVCLKAGLETTAWTKVSCLWNHFFLRGDSCMQSLSFNPWGNNKYYTVVLFRILQVKLFSIFMKAVWNLEFNYSWCSICSVPSKLTIICLKWKLSLLLRGVRERKRERSKESEGGERENIQKEKSENVVFAQNFTMAALCCLLHPDLLVHSPISGCIVARTVLSSFFLLESHVLSP